MAQAPLSPKFRNLRGSNLPTPFCTPTPQRLQVSLHAYLPRVGVTSPERVMRPLPSDSHRTHLANLGDAGVISSVRPATAPPPPLCHFVSHNHPLKQHRRATTFSQALAL
ncbi:hypothetical protein V8G54_028442 [Vigna mungo]|uniref:Uncharacterized protein n=1 Tax=Vigna mungo TaxID=3915 RepID=A0AAQ3MSK8_VIGMU